MEWGMGEWTGSVTAENRIFWKYGQGIGYPAFFLLKSIFYRTIIGQYVLLNSDVDGNNMNKSDAIDKENYIPGEPIFTGDIDIPGMTEDKSIALPVTAEMNLSGLIENRWMCCLSAM